jgi:hypothetical protein
VRLQSHYSYELVFLVISGLNILNNLWRVGGGGAAKPITEIRTRNLPWGERQPAHKADITNNIEPVVWKMQEP